MANKKEEEELLTRAQAEQALAGLGYEKSEEVLAAEQALADYTAQKPGEYVSSYQQQLEELTDRILNRREFDYSFDADPLYQQYRDMSVRSARLALQDTAAQAAAGTGGYGSSYSAAAAGAAYQQQMARLGVLMPELYQAAWERYADEGDALQKQLTGLTTLERDARNAYEAEVDDYHAGLRIYTDAAQAAYDRDIKQFENRKKALQDLRDYYAGQEQQQVKNQQAQAEYELAVKKYEETVRKREQQERQWEAEFALQQQRYAAQAATADQAVSSTKATAGTGTASAGNGGGRANVKAMPTEIKSTSELSSAAKKVQREVNFIAGQAIASGSNDMEKQARELLRANLKSGAITRQEADYIGSVWGVRF